jgi:hypothetical protein
MYRGVVTELEEKEGSLFIRLENAEGTDFGYGKILMQTDGDTKTNFREGELKAGDHLEAWFSDRNDGLPPIILTATKLPAVEATVFNGETVRFETRENGEKELELRGLKGEGDIIFRISDETRLYIGESELTPGAWVNVYHQGDLTGSAPPQGRALEIRPYKAKS